MIVASESHCAKGKITRVVRNQTLRFRYASCDFDSRDVGAVSHQDPNSKHCEELLGESCRSQLTIVPVIDSCTSVIYTCAASLAQC